MCYHPNVLMYKKNAVLTKDGRLGVKRLKIIFPYEEYGFKGYEYYLNENQRLKEQYQKNPYGERIAYKLIPCGKCIACRKSETFAWSTRIELESKKYNSNYFITLTYNDESIFVPQFAKAAKTGIIYKNDGTWQGALIKEDVYKFMDSLRKWIKRDYDWDGIKYYACGEYGEIGQRPHYHIILMNMPPIELTPWGQNKKTKHPYFTNERMEKIWGKGLIDIGEVTWDSIAYVAGYCQKKRFGIVKDETYAMRGQSPIFSAMSRRPGIGRDWYEEHKYQIYEYDEIINGKGNSIKPPSYFDRLMDIGEHDVMDNIKDIREEQSLNRLKKKMSKTDKTIKEQLLIEERTAKDKLKKYNRGRIE